MAALQQEQTQTGTQEAPHEHEEGGREAVKSSLEHSKPTWAYACGIYSVWPCSGMVLVWMFSRGASQPCHPGVL